MSQNGGPIVAGDMGVYNGELYWGWTEDVDGVGPYVAKWNGSAWDIIADETIFTPSFKSTLPKFATDGVNLFFAYLTNMESIISDCRSLVDGTITFHPFFARVWKFDGTSWTDLGRTGTGLVFNDVGEDQSSVALELSASPAEVGACYAAFFEEGYEGTNAALYWASRHLTVSGFGTSTLGDVFFDSLLFEPARDRDGFGRCIAPDDFAPQGFQMRLVASGDDLTFYTQ